MYAYSKLMKAVVNNRIAEVEDIIIELSTQKIMETGGLNGATW